MRQRRLRFDFNNRKYPLRIARKDIDLHTEDPGVALQNLPALPL